jgi:hypothetical protein
MSIDKNSLRMLLEKYLLKNYNHRTLKYSKWVYLTIFRHPKVSFNTCNCSSVSITTLNVTHIIAWSTVFLVNKEILAMKS